MLVRRIRILAEIVLCSLLFLFFTLPHMPTGHCVTVPVNQIQTLSVSFLVEVKHSSYTASVGLLNSWTCLTCEAQLTQAFISVNMVIDTSAFICRSPGLFPKVLTSDEWGGESKEETQRFLVDRWNREERKRERGSWVSEALMVWNGSLKYICAPVLYNWKRCTSAASPFSCMWQN